MKPVWILDIDDVLNFHVKGGRTPSAWRKVGGDTTTFGFKATVSGKTYDIVMDMSLDVISFIAAMSDRVDIVWGTSWLDRDYANTHIGLPLGIGPFPSLYDLAGVTGASLEVANLPFKVKAVKALTFPGGAMHGRPLIWTDDELSKTIRTDIKGVLDAHDVPSLLIKPFVNVGLRPDDLNRITTFVEGT